MSTLRKSLALKNLAEESRGYAGQQPVSARILDAMALVLPGQGWYFTAFCGNVFRSLVNRRGEPATGLAVVVR